MPFIFRVFALSAIIFTLAKPQTRNVEQRTEGEGIEVVLCIDVSGSMTAQDLTPNRLEAAKSVAIDFVNRRPTDRIGIVIFAGESFTQCPLTTDHNVVIAAIKNIRNGLLVDGTAIGSGLSTSVDRIRNSKSKSKVIILLTDGENNGGLIDPQTAKEIAKAFAIKVYTIGVGTIGEAPMPYRNPDGSISTRMQKVAIDEPLMQQIATETGGRYFRATDNNSLAEIYTSIDKLEKTKVEVIKNVHFKNKFLPFVAAAIFFLMLEIVFRYLLLRKFP
ncbi:MAG TPA: VWA domain-containing protein [Ferruginibacter sp.]|nr:VWA domain-containing protein [Ferruginibacter sp.]HRB22503.1 VWA domain-containing protein [Ferruginibacter sp.]